MLQPDTGYLGIDLSNWQGELTTEDIRQILVSGTRFAIVRLSVEDSVKSALAITQIAALQNAGIPCMGYGWCYWSALPSQQAALWAQLGELLQIRAIAMDAEDPPVIGLNCVTWLALAARALDVAGYVPIAYSDPGWWQSNHIDLSPLGNIRWWVAEWNGNRDLVVTSPYPGARIMGHQYADVSAGTTKRYDSDFMFVDKEMLMAGSNQTPVSMTPDDVAGMIDARLDRIPRQLKQGDSFDGLIGDLVERVEAAGRALDPSEPVPGSQPAQATAQAVAAPTPAQAPTPGQMPSSGEQHGPAEAYATP